MNRRRQQLRHLKPADAYNCWSATYDSQPDNAVLALESRLFTDLLRSIPVEGTTVIDVGCGTGRHWDEILSHRPARLLGADPSKGMLEKLSRKYPKAEIYNCSGDRLSEVPELSCDLVISTLALAHVPDPKPAIEEWSRVLRTGGNILITDFHADAIRAGMKRSFTVDEVTVEIDHCATQTNRLQELAGNCGLKPMRCVELAIDESVRPLFERDRALDAYEQYKGLNLVFALHFTKP